MKRQAISLMLCASLFFTLPAYADLRDDLSYIQQKLNDTNDYLDTLNQRQQEIQNSVNEYNSEIFDLSIQIEQAKLDIETTEKAIEEKEKEIECTEESLLETEDSKNIQYENMKKRIQCIYEQGGDAGIFISILNETDIYSILNKIEYTDNLEKYDKLRLEEFISTIKAIQFLKERLETENKELKEQKELYETQKEGLEENQKELENKLKEAEENNNQTYAEMAIAQQQAVELFDIIQATQAAIEEEERAAREAEEVRLAEQQSAESERDEDDYYEPSYDNNDDEEESSNYSYSGGSGDDIVSYAEQFIGYPYVWGGNSLTGGIDCSHFVYQVLKNTGHYGGDYETSGGWPYLGSHVSSLSEARAGDVICYSGHVAIYDGYGGIIEAKGSAWGITHDRSATCKTIVAIRRFT